MYFQYYSTGYFNFSINVTLCSLFRGYFRPSLRKEPMLNYFYCVKFLLICFCDIRFSEPFPPVKPYYHRNIAPLVDDPIKGRLFGEAGNYIGQYPPEYIAPIDCEYSLALLSQNKTEKLGIKLLLNTPDII